MILCPACGGVPAQTKRPLDPPMRGTYKAFSCPCGVLEMINGWLLRRPGCRKRILFWFYQGHVLLDMRETTRSASGKQLSPREARRALAPFCENFSGMVAVDEVLRS